MHKLTRSQRWKLHALNRNRVARGLSTISTEVAFMALGENEQKLTADRNEKYPFDLQNDNYRNNGNIVNLDNPSFQDVERGGYLTRVQFKKDRFELKVKPFTLNAGDVINILPRDDLRDYLEIQSDGANTTSLYMLFYTRDDVLITALYADAYGLTAGAKKLFENKVPINAISLHNPSATLAVTGSIFWG